MAFDAFEPIGTRPPLDLLALLTTMYANAHRRKGMRALIPQDILRDPLAPRRLSASEETERTLTTMHAYRTKRAERLRAQGIEPKPPRKDRAMRHWGRRNMSAEDQPQED